MIPRPRPYPARFLSYPARFRPYQARFLSYEGERAPARLPGQGR